MRLWSGMRSGGRSDPVSVFFSLNVMKTGEVRGDWRLTVQQVIFLLPQISLRRGVTNGKKVRVVKLANTK